MSKRLWLTLMMISCAFCMRAIADEQAKATEESVQTETTTEEQATAEETNPMVLLKTSKGDIKIELYPDKAPDTVENFLQYVDDKHYDGTIFHRVIDNFMIQGGGFDEDMNQKSTRKPVKNEADNGLKNDVGTIAMARTSDPNSATAQFFINVKDNDFLNYSAPTMRGWGYCVFGKVIDGMDVVNDIKKAKTGSKNFMQDVPVETIEIISAERINE